MYNTVDIKKSLILTSLFLPVSNKNNQLLFTIWYNFIEVTLYTLSEASLLKHTCTEPKALNITFVTIQNGLKSSA